MNCKNCGATISSGDGFCQSCGTPVESGANQTPPVMTPPPTYSAPQQQYSNAPAGMDPRFDYTPISMWGYFGYQLLFAVPCIGFIMLLVFSFGGTKNINLRNFARSYFCLLIIFAIIGGIIVALGGAGALMSSY